MRNKQAIEESIQRMREHVSFEGDLIIELLLDIRELLVSISLSK